MSQQPFIVCQNLVKIYKLAELEVVALQGLDLLVQPGELVAIVGKSGSGKSSLLQILGGLSRPSAGKVEIDGKDMLTLDDAGLVHYTRHTVGFVWQQTGRNLLPYLSALQNVEMPMLVAGVGARARRERARELLELVGLGHRAGHGLTSLSGGEQQRVAIGVALANDPPLVLADEPTGELDGRTALQVMQLFDRLAVELGKTVVIVSHDADIKQYVERVVQIRDGRTSTEIVRHEGPADERSPEARHVEYTVLDRAGRLQLPADVVEELGMQGRVTVELTPEGVIVRPVNREGTGNANPSAPGA